MKILLACEESQAVTIEMRKLGHEAYSCDLMPCSGGYPEWHYQCNVIDLIDDPYWDMVIAFPPCTDLAVSGARWFEEKRAKGSQIKAIEFFMRMLNAKCEKVAVENPVNIISGEYVKKYFPELADFYGLPIKPTQSIQPWQFGHGETKKTCLWLKGLEPLRPTDVVEGREQRIWKMPPGPERGKERSKTFSGIARAMAEQWAGRVV